MEAIILTEIGMPTLRTEISKKANTEAIAKDLDMEDELREATVMCITSYQQRTENSYNRHVKHHAFQSKDLVLRKVFRTRLTRQPENTSQIGRVHTR